MYRCVIWYRQCLGQSQSLDGSLPSQRPEGSNRFWLLGSHAFRFYVLCIANILTTVLNLNSTSMHMATIKLMNAICKLPLTALSAMLMQRLKLTCPSMLQGLVEIKSSIGLRDKYLEGLRDK
jgi:hypothetical protein